MADYSDGIGWHLMRWLIRWRFERAAHQVLRARRLERSDGQYERWFAKNVVDFLARLETQAAGMRPIANLDKLPSVGNRLMVELAIYTAAAYRALLDMGITEQSARSALADMGWIVYSRMLRLSSLPFRLVVRDAGKRLRGTIRLLLRFPFDAPGPPGYEVRVWRDGENILTHFTRCPPQSFVRELIAQSGDRGDLDAFYESWCLYDWPGADLIVSDGARGHYERHQALSRGDSVCDMCWKADASSGQVSCALVENHSNI